MASVAALDIKSKCGVSPLITHPNAMKPSYFLIFLDIITGISNTPGTVIQSFFNLFFIKITFAWIVKSSDGDWTLSLTDVQTAALASGRYVYDLVIIASGGDKTRVVEGIATIKPSVSR